MAVSLPLFSTTSGSAIPSPLLPFSPRCISPRLVLASCSFQPRTTLLSMSLQREGDNAGMDGVAGEDDGHGITYFASSQQPALGSQHWTADEQQATIREPDEVPDRRRRHLLGMVDDRNSNMEESHRSRNPRVSPRLLSRSIGSRSIPSQSSVPGKYSKYSHPATTSKSLKASTSGKLSNDSVSSTFSFPSTLEPVDCVFPDAEEASAASPMDLRSSLLSPKSLHDGNSVRSGSSLSSKAVPSTNADAVPRAGSRSLTWLQQPGHDVSSRKNDLFLPDEALSSDSMFAASGVDSRYSSWSQQSANNANSEDKSSFLPENISSPSHTLNAASPAYSRSSPFSRKSVNTRNSVRKSSFLPQSTFPSDSIVASQTMSPSWSEHSVDDVDSEEVFSSDSDNTDFQAYSRPSTLPQKPACDVNLVRRGTFPFKRKKGLNFKRKIIGSTNASIATENPRQTLSDLPFDPQYSYSETPKVAPIGYREPQYSPFGPLTMGRPWTGRAPLKPSKKKLPEFDSFNPPRAGKKGVKYVQQPGPFPMNQGPKEVKSREEILGEPLSKEEIQELVESCMREKRQTNLGRDGLIHNMLDLIHTHWKRRRVCRVRCLGVPTVDMDNVCFHLEDKTGGKVIHRAGGVVYLFRGRYYNYRNRPRIPIMLWKPAAPVYPKLIQPSPGGLTMEAANALRKIGRKVVPLCKLGKNGVYVNLVNDVRDAFRIDELVRVDCTGLNPSDYKKIGAKLQELVPCVLLSFEKEHILMWRGKSNTKVDDFNENADTTQNKAVPSVEETSSLKAENVSLEQNEKNLVTDGVSDFGELNPSLVGDELMEQGDERSVESMTFLGYGQNNSPLIEVALSEQSSEPETFSCSSGVTSLPFEDVLAEQCDKPMHLSEYSGISSPIIKDGPAQQTNESNVPSIFNPESERIQIESHGQSLHTSETDQKNGDFIEKNEFVDNFKNLDFSWRLAIESGTAIVLDDADSDADLVLQKTIEFAKVAPYAPPYRHSLLHILSYKKKNTEHISFERKARKRQTMRRPKKNPTQITGPPLEVPPFGGLGVDELAKLLAP